MNRHPVRRAAAAIALPTLATAASAVVDQVSPPANGGALQINQPGFQWQQQEEVVVGVAGQLVGIDLFYVFAQPFNQPQDFHLALYGGAGWHADAGTALLGPTALTPFVGTMSLDPSAAGLRFNVGDTFVIALTALGPNTDCCAIEANFGLYTSGQLFLWGTPYDYGGDLTFTTCMAPVPEPSRWALVALGLAGMAGLARRRSAGQS